MRENLREKLICPRDGTPLEYLSSRLSCAQGHEYPSVNGIPVILLDDVEQTAWWSKKSIEKAWDLVKSGQDRQENLQNVSKIDEHVQRIVASTCGHLYKHLVGKLNRYPIPDLRLPESRQGRLLLDIGCNWGRWSVAAARKGYQVVGIDPSLDALLAAQRVAQQLGVEADFIVADARYLPFRAGIFDVVFSYSVIQHFSKENAKSAVREIARTLHPNGVAMIQMPNWLGLRCLYHQAKRRFHEGKEFDVRYWSLPELKRTFSELVGPTELSIDGYFGLGIQKSDVDLLPLRYRFIVNTSEFLRQLSKHVGWMKYFADSIYVTSHRGS